MNRSGLLFPDGLDTGLYLPTVKGGQFNTDGKRFLVDVYPDFKTQFIYVTRLLSVAAEDNKRDINQMQSLINGRIWETEVKYYLLQHGLSVESPDFTRDDKGKPDLIVNGKHIVEVKSYGGERYAYTSPETYPYNEVWTDEAYQTTEKYKQAQQLGGDLFYIIVSQQTGIMVGFRYHPRFFNTNQKGKTVGKRSQLLPINLLLPYLKNK